MNNEAASEHKDSKSKLALYLSGILLAVTITTFKLVVTKTHGD